MQICKSHTEANRPAGCDAQRANWPAGCDARQAVHLMGRKSRLRRQILVSCLSSPGGSARGLLNEPEKVIMQRIGVVLSFEWPRGRRWTDEPSGLAGRCGGMGGSARLVKHGRVLWLRGRLPEGPFVSQIRPHLQIRARGTKRVREALQLSPSESQCPILDTVWQQLDNQATGGGT